MVGELDDINDFFKLYTPTSETIASILRSLLPVDWRPPTHRQMAYASTIASGLGLYLPENALRDTTVCSEFIAENVDAYNLAKEEKRLLKKKPSKTLKEI